MPTDNSVRGSLWSCPGNTSGSRFVAYAGTYTDRQSRFEARSARRWGDWGILEFSPALLWLDNAYAVSPYGEFEFVEPALVEELWL